MKIVRAKPEDAEKISKLRIETIKAFPQDNPAPGEMDFIIKRNTPEIIKEKIKTRDIFNMIEKGEIIGNVELNGDKLNNLYVDKNNIKRGIGKKLLLFIEDYAKKKGVKKFYFRSTPSAVPFYKKFGYKIVKVERTKQEGIEMTHNMMEKELK
jgi:putative acetyltransferase